MRDPAATGREQLYVWAVWRAWQSALVGPRAVLSLWCQEKAWGVCCLGALWWQRNRDCNAPAVRLATRGPA